MTGTSTFDLVDASLDLVDTPPLSKPREPHNRLRQILMLSGFVIYLGAGIVVLGSKYWFLWLGFPFGLAALLVAAKQPKIFIFLFYFSLPFESLILKNFSNLGTPAKIIGALLLVTSVVAIVLDPKRLEAFRSWTTALLLAWLVIVGLSVLDTIHMTFTLSFLRDLVAVLVIFMFLPVLVRDRTTFKQVMLFTIAGTAVASLVSFSGLGTETFYGANVGFMDDPNYLGTLYLVTFMFSLGFFFAAEGSPWLRLFWGCVAILLCTTILLAQSRSSLIVLAVSFLFWLPEFKRLVNLRNVGLLSLVAMIGIGVLAYNMPKGLVDRFEALLMDPSKTKDASYARRGTYVIVAMDNIVKRPFLGSGFGTYPVLYAHTGYAGFFGAGYEPEEGSSSKSGAFSEALYRMTHNTWLQMTVETGIFGGLLYLLIPITCIVRMRWAQRTLVDRGDVKDAFLAKSIWASMLCFMLMLLMITAYNNKYYWLVVGLSLAFSASFNVPRTPPPRIGRAAGRLPS